MAEIPKKYKPLEREIVWQKYWAEKGVYNYDRARPRAETYSIDTPPPTVSGLIHMGHVFSYTQMDIIARYKKLRGYNVFYPFGFDDNGLPTERMVERRIGRRAIEMPRDEFIKLCLEETARTETEFKEMWRRIGLSVDWRFEYSTINEASRRVAQSSFIDLYKKGHVYRKEEPTIWDVDNRTALAQAEMEDRELDSVFSDILFEFEDGTKVAIATTRPELLPACVAVICHPEDERYKRFVGGRIKTPYFDIEVPVFTDPLVDMEKGTGIVMCCTFGDMTDIEWWRRYKLETRIVITPDGRLNELAGEFAGLTLKEGRKAIVEKLKEHELLTKQEKIKHMVKCGEKSRAPVEYIVSPQWFVRVLDRKDEIIARAREISWWPEFMWVRFQHWVENLAWDWCISRQRYYGVAFPLWYCKACGEVKLADEKSLPIDPLAVAPDTPCKCGSTDFEPEKDVMDTWMTSSCTPQLASGWVDEPEHFEKLFPFSMRPQAHDIIRTWAFYTIIKGLLHEDKMPWENIFISGHALDEKRKKQSKSKGNVVEPKKYIDMFGADVLRYWTSTAKLGLDTSFSEKVLSLGKRLVTKIFNASKFAHMHLSEYDGGEPDEWHVTDRWLISKLGRIVESVTKSYDEYEFSDARSSVEDFFWAQFCDDYLELAKGRLYSEEDKFADMQKSARATLYRALLAILRMFAPTLPHITEEVFSWMYAEREGALSINADGWPDAGEFTRDVRAEQLGDLACELLAGVRKYKSEISVSIKRPIARLVVARGTQKPPGDDLWEALKNNEDKVLFDFINAANVLDIEFADEFPEYARRDETGTEGDERPADDETTTGSTESPNGVFYIIAELAPSDGESRAR